MRKKGWNRLAAGLLCAALVCADASTVFVAEEVVMEEAAPEGDVLTDASSQTELADTQTETEHLGTENNDAEDLPDDSMLIEDEDPGETLPPDYGTDQETELAGNTEDESESETESESVTESETETEELLLEETESESEAESELGAMSGTCGLNGAKVQWALDDSGTLTVSGSGAMDDYYVYRDLTTGSVVESHLPPWNDIRIRSKITSVVIADGVTSVGQNAFGNCYSLEKVIVGNSVKTIKNSAFSDCGVLKEIRLGNKIESIGNHAFYYSPVTGLTLPASLKTLSRYALTGLWEMQNVSVASGSSVFQSRDGVLMTDGGKTLVYYPAGRTGAYAIPNGVTKIGAYAFSQALVTGVTIPNTVTELGETAFSECDGLTSLVIPGSVKAVPSFFCYACQNLSSVSLGNGLKEIGTYAFKGCEALKTVTIPASVTSIGENAFSSGTKVTISTGGLHRQEDGSYIDALKVKVNVQEKYKTAFEILTLVNKERAKAGVPALKMDQSLLESAMQRAAETSLYWSHTRPTGSNCFSANSLMRGENIAYGVSSASAVMNMWMNSPGHRANILGSGYTSIGIGCVKTDTGYYYVQCFGADVNKAVSASSYADKTSARTVALKKDKEYYGARFLLSKKSLKAGETANIRVQWENRGLDSSGELSVNGVKAVSSNTAVCKIEGGKVRAVGAGTAKITMYHDGYKEGGTTVTVTVSGNRKVKKVTSVSLNRTSLKLEVGKSYTLKATVKPTSATNKKVTWSSSNKKVAEVKNGKIVAKAKGKAVITVKAADGSGKTARCTVTVMPKVTAPGKPVLSRWSSVKGKKATVKFKAVKGAAGYEVRCSSSSSFKKDVKKITTTKTSATFSKLTKNKIYYVKVRAYKKDSSGKKIYGGYSAVKKMKAE